MRPLASIAFRHFSTLGSTNDEAKKIISSEDGHGLFVTADDQTAGRGRHGRQWVSGAGNFFGSLILAPEAAPEKLQELVFVAALAVSDIIPGSALKWPNDLLINGRKVSGILLETHHLPGKPPVVVAGIGINLVRSPEIPDYPATSLKAEGQGLSAAGCQRLLAESFIKRYEAWRIQGFEVIEADWMARAHPPFPTDLLKHAAGH